MFFCAHRTHDPMNMFWMLEEKLCCGYGKWSSSLMYFFVLEQRISWTEKGKKKPKQMTTIDSSWKLIQCRFLIKYTTGSVAVWVDREIFNRRQQAYRKYIRANTRFDHIHTTKCRNGDKTTHMYIKFLCVYNTNATSYITAHIYLSTTHALHWYGCEIENIAK